MRLAMESGWDEETIWDWPYEKLARWMAYFELEPFGPIQEDLRAGMECSLLYNSNRGKDSPAKAPEDFFPSLAPPEEVSERQDRAKQVWMMRLFTAMSKRHGKKHS
jgi:hypothetical protein